MKHLLITFTLLLASVSGFSIEATEITSFKSGYVCDAAGVMWLCHETSDIYITGQGTCTYNKEDMPCTWYGFYFTYTDNEPGTKLVCEYSQNHLSDYGNPDEVVEESINKGTYDLPLDKAEGSFFNPQYSVLRITESGEKTESVVTQCKINGKLVATFTFNKKFPSRDSLPVDL